MAVVRLLIFTIITLSTGAAKAAEVMVATASNFAAPMRHIAAEYEQQTGHKVKLAFGSSGKFFAQIKNGAPYQLFFSADQAKPAALEQAGMVVPDSRFTYALGALALWSATAGLVDRQGAVLKRNRFNKLAIANPRLAPYGAAAREVLQNLDVYDGLAAKLVRGENIAQTYQFVSTGNAELGFVALSQIVSPGRQQQGSTWIVPGHLFTPIRQDAVLLRRGKDNSAARQLLRYMRGERAREIIESYGYKMAEER